MVGPAPGVLPAEEDGVGHEGGHQSQDDRARKLPQGHPRLLAVIGSPAFEHPFVRDSRPTANPSALLPVYRVG